MLRPPSTSVLAAPGSASLSLLGGFELTAGGEPVHLPAQAEALVAFLALQRRELHRAYVAGRLWPELSQEHAFGCLRSTLWRMGRMGLTGVVVTSATRVGLRPGVPVDARELETLAEDELHGGGPLRDEVLDRLVHTGELLPDWYADWVEQERERLRLLRLLALEAAAERLLEERRYADASRAALAALGTDALRESAYRLLIRAQLGQGNAAEALRQFGLLREALQAELGLEPSDQTAALVRGVA